MISQQSVRIVRREPAKKGAWTESPPIRWANALVLPDTTTEKASFGQNVESQWRIVGPIPDPLPRAQDLILVDGLEPETLRLHVLGRVQVRTTLGGTPHHAEGLLKLWEG